MEFFNVVYFTDHYYLHVRLYFHFSAKPYIVFNVVDISLLYRSLSFARKVIFSLFQELAKLYKIPSAARRL